LQKLSTSCSVAEKEDFGSSLSWYQERIKECTNTFHNNNNNNNNNNSQCNGIRETSLNYGPENNFYRMIIPYGPPKKNELTSSPNVLFLGLPSCGKDEILSASKIGTVTDDDTYIPNQVIKMLTFKKLNVLSIDITEKDWSIQKNVIQLLLTNSHCIVFVINAADKSQLNMNSKLLKLCTQLPEAKKLPILILGNKNNQLKELSIPEFIKELDYNELFAEEENDEEIEKKSK